VVHARRSVAVLVASTIVRAQDQVRVDTGSREVVVFVRSCEVVKVLRGLRVAGPDGCHDEDCGGQARGVPLVQGGASRRGLSQRASRSGFVGTRTLEDERNRRAVERSVMNFPEYEQLSFLCLLAF